MNRFCEQFGLTPSSRSRIVAEGGEDKESDADAQLLHLPRHPLPFFFRLALQPCRTAGRFLLRLRLARVKAPLAEAEEFITQHGTIVKTPSGYWQQVPQVSIAQTYLKIDCPPAPLPPWALVSFRSAPVPPPSLNI